MAEAHLWTGGRIFTGVRYARALLVDRGRVVAVGSELEVERLAPTGTERHRLDGRLVVPGLLDAHLHVAEIARLTSGLDLRGIRSKADLIETVATWARAHPDGAVVGRGWDPERWGRHDWPTAADLAPAVGDRRAVLYHASGHAALVSESALSEIGIDPAHPAPPDPAVGRAPDGRPNGLLFEEAMRPLASLVQTSSPVDDSLLERVLADLLPLGVTGVGTMSAAPEEVAGLARLASAGRVPIEVRAYVRLRELAEGRVRRAGPPVGRFSVAGVKVFLDGAFGPRTASLSAPYADAPETSGLSVGDDRELAEWLAVGVEGGLAPAVHAIGDSAVRRALRLIAPLVGRTPAPARVEHASLVPPEQLETIDRVRPTLVVQPGFVWSDDWLVARLGVERARWAYPWATLLRRGAALAGSSDAPFDPVDPWRGIRAAQGRRNPEGRSANPDPAESLSVEEAVTMYTVGAARAVGVDDGGQLAPGARADLVLLDGRDLETICRRVDVPVRATWVGGRCAYERPAAPPN